MKQTNTKAKTTKKPVKVENNARTLWIIIICVTVALALVIGGVALYIYNQEVRPIPPSKQDVTVVGSCDGFDVYYEELRYVTMLYKTVMEQEYGKDIFNSDNADKYREELMKNVLENITANYAVLSLCREYNIDINDSEMQKAAGDEVLKFVETSGSFSNYKKELEKQYLTDHFVRFTFAVNACQRELFIAMTEYTDVINTDPEVLRDKIDSEFIRTQHVYIQKGLENSLESAEYVASVLADDPDRVNEMIGKYSTGDASLDGSYFTYGEMIDAYEDAAFALGINEASGVVEVDDGYYIIVRLPKDDDYIDRNIVELMDRYVNIKFYEIIDERQAELVFSFNEYGSSIDLTEMK